MNILYHHRTGSKDGQAVHIEELIAAFRRRGHAVRMVGPDMTERQQFGGESRLVRTLKRSLPGFVYEILEFGYSLLAYRRLEAACAEFRPDVLYERANLFLLAGLWLKRRRRVPMFLEVNAPLFEERRRYDGLSLKSFARWTERTAWRGADRVLPVTRVLAADVLAAGVPEERIAVIPNGINRGRFLRTIDSADAKAGLGFADRIVLGFTGFVRSWHGLDTVIDLIARADDPRLLLYIVGDGPGRAELEAHAGRLGVGHRLRFAGLVARDSVADHVAAFDIALQPSVTPYASPLKLFEYLALGRPVVAPASANILEILEDGKTALLFTPGDTASFGERIERLCADAALREQIGAAGRRLIEERDLTWDGNAARLERLFASVIGQAPAPRGERAAA